MGPMSATANLSVAASRKVLDRIPCDHSLSRCRLREGTSYRSRGDGTSIEIMLNDAWGRRTALPERDDISFAPGGQAEERRRADLLATDGIWANLRDQDS